MSVDAKSSYLRFWGKAGGDQPSEPGWHPVAYHCLDVAAVADLLLFASPRKLARLTGLLGTSADNARRFLVCLVALHDVGKFSSWFQGKNQQAWDESVKPVLGAWKPPPASRHDADGYDLRDALNLRKLLHPATQTWRPKDLIELWVAVTGHHGQPANQYRSILSDGLTRPCRDAAAAFVADVRALFEPLDPLPRPSAYNLRILSWLLCGLTVVSDWIGSNRDWFPYRHPDQTLPEYWIYARGRAAPAIDQTGLRPRRRPPELTPERLLPARIADNLSPLQKHVSQMLLPDGPLMAIVEDVTGSGKTEAALLLAARLMKSGRADGLYFALPTMATANAMYDRLARSYEKLFADGSKPSLVLAHGKRALNSAFTDSILPLRDIAESYEDEGAATCAAWIADDRRKAFLAHVGVGTIDQALLGVLPSRHQVLRLWGLSDRVLIIDEAHAYDTYMSRELESLLEFQAALGGSAIVLSATLPRRQQTALAQSFARGLGVIAEDPISNGYPLLTCVSCTGSTSEHLASRQDRERALPVRRLTNEKMAIDHVVEMARQDCAVAWIRNAVDDAIEAATALTQQGLTPVLLHTRFAMGDRLDIEQRVRAALGLDDKIGVRRGFVVVGTQILEQSLDYDVDAMVTDLAPIDLVIQRAGRLWRHSDRRPRPVERPELCIVSPDPEQVDNADWYRSMSARAAAVYAHHGIIWRSAKTLFDTGLIVTPDGVRGLIDCVYAIDGLDDIPEPLRRASQNAHGKEGAARSFANANLLKVDQGYGGCQELWLADTITPTRLGEPVTVFRMGRVSNGAIMPWYPDGSLARAWALSEVSLSRRRADGVPTSDPAREKLMAQVKTSWPKWEHDIPLLVLEPDGDMWRADVKLGATIVPVVYDTKIGLRFSA